MLSIDPGQVLQALMSLMSDVCHQAVSFGTDQTAVMLCGW